jgi:hypothetical protein
MLKFLYTQNFTFFGQTWLKVIKLCKFLYKYWNISRDAGTMWRQGGQIFVKLWALLNWYILRDVCKTSGVELRLILFSIYWMIGVWGGSPPGDCAITAILEARWQSLHFLHFLKQIRKRSNCTNISDNSLFRQGNPLNWKGTFTPLAPPGKGQRGRLPPSSGVPEY